MKDNKDKEVSNADKSLVERLNALKEGLGDGIIEDDFDKRFNEAQQGKTERRHAIKGDDLDKQLEEIEKGIKAEDMQAGKQVRGAMKEIDELNKEIEQGAQRRIDKGQKDFDRLDKEIRQDIAGMLKEKAEMESKVDSKKVNDFAKKDVSFDDLDKLTEKELNKLGEKLDKKQPKVQNDLKETSKSFEQKLVDMLKNVVSFLTPGGSKEKGAEHDARNFSKEVEKLGKDMEASISSFESRMKEFDKKAGLDSIVDSMKTAIHNKPEQGKEAVQNAKTEGVGKFTDRVLNEQGGQSRGRWWLFYSIKEEGMCHMRMEKLWHILLYSEKACAKKRTLSNNYR